MNGPGSGASRVNWWRRSQWLALVVGVLPLAGCAWGQGAATTDERVDYAKSIEIPGAERVGTGQCLSCHDDAAQGYRRAVHAQNNVTCEGCHGPGSLHVKSSDYGQIIKFKEASPQAATGVCLRCHANSSHLLNWSSGTHAAYDVRCTSCHRAHVADPTLVSRGQESDICLPCHRTQAAQGNLPYHHPVREGKLRCADCHDPHGGVAANNLKEENVNQLCLQCHTEYAGPFTYQHDPVTENCLICHAPHGSMNRGLLKVSQPFLCLQCHTGHHNGTSVPLLNPCSNCHSSIHGTDTPSATGGSIFIDKGRAK